MLTLRRADARGQTHLGWLDSRHTFSFGEYDDPAQLGFRALRVINEDRVAPGKGFPTHAHRDMEIVSVVLEGQIAHQDSLGNGSLIKPGEVQRMSAGSGVRHSEFNPSPTEPLHFLQIWIVPERLGLPPGYAQKAFAPEGRAGKLQRVASRDGAAGSLTLHQDATVFLTSVGAGERLSHALALGRAAWVQVLNGALFVNGVLLHTGDGAALTDEASVDLRSQGGAEALVFDLA